MEKLIIGSHVSFTKEEGLLGSVKESLSYGENTFMFYTGAPQNTIRGKIDEEKTKEAQTLMKENNIDIKDIIIHAPYIINLANNKDEDKFNFAVNFLKQELTRAETLGIKKVVMHPGSHVGLGVEKGIENIVKGLNKVLDKKEGPIICLETMVGKGTELGKTFEEIKTIIDGTIYKERLLVCLDTCHLNDAGYDMSKFDEFLNEFKKYISVDKIKCVHINDSKNVQSSHKDRHANIGFGTIGFDNILKIVHHPTLIKIPKILETPYIGENDEDKNRIYPPYKFEINMLKNQQFDADILNKIREYYK